MENEIEYILEDAARTVYENISLDLKLKILSDDILKVLNIEFDYQL